YLFVVHIFHSATGGLKAIAKIWALLTPADRTGRSHSFGNDRTSPGCGIPLLLLPARVLRLPHVFASARRKPLPATICWPGPRLMVLRPLAGVSSRYPAQGVFSSQSQRIPGVSSRPASGIPSSLRTIFRAENHSDHLVLCMAAAHAFAETIAFRA